jgi:uncharacterized protein (TIGR03083 family)
MPTTVEIAPMVDLLVQGWAAVDELCSDLDDAAYATPTCLPGWTVQDQLAHLVATELMLEGVPAPKVDVSHLDYLRNDVARMNEVWIEDMRSLSGPEVLERFREVTARRGAALAAMDQSDFDAPSWTPVGADETYGRFMRIRHYDTFLHEHDVRAALDLPDRPDAAAVRSALAETSPALGYIVGRKAALPDGSRVRLVLTGPVGVEYLVEVDGRAAVVDQLSGAADVTLTMPAMTFLRLTGGRVDGLERLAIDVDAAGNDTLARQLVANMTYTI